MRISLVKKIFPVFALAALFPALAMAQRMPQAGGWSVWGAAGLTNPAGDALDSAFGFSGGIDFYTTRNFSIGAIAGAWKSDADFGEDADEAYLTGVGTYNWERGKFHPFVQGGAGVYRVDFPRTSTETKFGGFAGGGLDIFVTRRMAVDLGLRYHFVPDVDGADAKFFEAHGGLKFYF